MYNNIVINELDNNNISTQTQNKTKRYEKIMNEHTELSNGLVEIY